MLNIVRFEQNSTAHWGLLQSAQVRTLNIPCTTTADLLALPRERLLEAASEALQPMAGLRLLSPVTTPCMVYCQGCCSCKVLSR